MGEAKVLVLAEICAGKCPRTGTHFVHGLHSRLGILFVVCVPCVREISKIRVLNLLHNWTPSASTNFPPPGRQLRHFEQCDVSEFESIARYRERKEWLSWYSFRKDEPKHHRPNRNYIF
jgi:hypothetical protein